MVEEHGHADNARDSPADAGRHGSRVDSTGYAPQLRLNPERTENRTVGALARGYTQITHTRSMTLRISIQFAASIVYCIIMFC